MFTECPVKEILFISIPFVHSLFLFQETGTVPCVRGMLLLFHQLASYHLGMT